jgi:sugar lactone lactonase YvrE
MKAIASGYRFPEAPTPGADGSIYFSDVLGGGVYRWSPDGSVETVLEKRRGIGGMCMHADGGLVVSGRDVIHVRDGDQRTLLANLEGVRGFNDLGVDREGRVYAGALRFMPFAGEAPVPGEVWVIGPEQASRALEGVDWANGIGFSPGGETIYVCDYAHGTVLAYDSSGKRVFARSPRGSADGLAVDETGGVWVAMGDGGGIARFDPDGSLREVVDVPASFVSSLCFGGEDMRDLYVTAVVDDVGGALLRGRADVAGAPVPPAAI